MHERLGLCGKAKCSRDICGVSEGGKETVICGGDGGQFAGCGDTCDTASDADVLPIGCRTRRSRAGNVEVRHARLDGDVAHKGFLDGDITRADAEGDALAAGSHDIVTASVLEDVVGGTRSQIVVIARDAEGIVGTRRGKRIGVIVHGEHVSRVPASQHHAETIIAEGIEHTPLVQCVHLALIAEDILRAVCRQLVVVAEHAEDISLALYVQEILIRAHAEAVLGAVRPQVVGVRGHLEEVVRGRTAQRIVVAASSESVSGAIAAEDDGPASVIEHIVCAGVLKADSLAGVADVVVRRRTSQRQLRGIADAVIEAIGAEISIGIEADDVVRAAVAEGDAAQCSEVIVLALVAQTDVVASMVEYVVRTEIVRLDVVTRCSERIVGAAEGNHISRGSLPDGVVMAVEEDDIVIRVSHKMIVVESREGAIPV